MYVINMRSVLVFDNFPLQELLMFVIIDNKCKKC